MTTTTSTFAPDRQAAAKQRLAQLLAAEGITVEWNPKARTASFNLVNRKVTMPVWKEIPEAAVDMLLAHEVAHALWSKDEAALIAAIDYIDPKNKQVAKAYLNVAEDPRIERLMKAKFGGIKGDFAKGYRWMQENDFFGLSKVGDISKMALIDRVNLHYKIGFILTVPFTAEELPLVQRVATTMTWDEMVEVAKELYDFAKGEGKAEENDEDKGEKGEKGKPKPDADGDEGDETDADGDDADGDDADGDDADGDEAEGDEGDETDADGDADGDEGDDAEGDETDADADADGDEGDEGDEGDADGDEGDETDGDADGDETDADGDAPPAAPTTMDNFDQNLADRLDTAAIPTYYADLPEIDKGIIVPLKTTIETLMKFEIMGQPTTSAAAAAMFNQWKSTNTAAVQMLATEFDRRMAAAELRRTATADTGTIDPNRLWAYRISDEIFATNTYVKDGKNHGLIVLLDMSASMGGIFTDTMLQLVNLAAFARRVGIPFRIYGFSDKVADMTEGAPFKANDGFDLTKTTMRLVTLFEDGMAQQTFQKIVGLMLLAAYQIHNGPAAYRDAVSAIEGFNRYDHTCIPKWLDLGNTPTNTAVLALSQVARNFKADRQLQILNLIVLTDGEPTDDLVNTTVGSKNFFKGNYTLGSSVSHGSRELVNIVWRDKVTNKDHKVTKATDWTAGTYIETIGSDGVAAVMNQVFRDRLGGKVVAIHLRDRNGIALVDSLLRNGDTTKKVAEFERLEKTWKAENWAAVANGRGYDDYIVIRTNLTAETKIDLTTNDPTTGAGLRKLRSDFGRLLAAAKGNRPLMVRVADLLAK